MTNFHPLIFSLLLVVLVDTPFVSAASSFGCTSTSIVDGRNSWNRNPASLALDSTTQWQVGLFQCSWSLGTSAIDCSDLRRYFSSDATAGQTAALSTGPTLNANQRDELFTKLAGGSVCASAHCDLVTISCSLGSTVDLAFSHFIDIGSRLSLPASLKSLVDGSVGTTNVNLDASHTHVLAFSGVKATLSMRLTGPSERSRDGLFAGLGVAHVQGLAYASLEPGSSISINRYVPEGWDSTTNLDVRTNVTTSTAGLASGTTSSALATLLSSMSGLGSENAGWGCDVGLRFCASTEQSRYQIGVGLSNIGTINWQQARTERFQSRDTIRSYQDFETLYHNESPSSVNVGRLSTALPSTLECTAEYEWAHLYGCAVPLRLEAAILYGIADEAAAANCPEYAVALGSGQWSCIPDCSIGYRYSAIDGSTIGMSVGWQIGDHCKLIVHDADMQSLLFPSRAHWYSASVICSFVW